jgi:Bacterial DNA polymerase III alpha NTPase domain
MARVRHRTTLDSSGRLLERNAERHLRTAKEMQQLFYDYPEAIGNTSELSARLQFDLSKVGYEFPPYEVPNGEPMDSFLRKRVDEGIRLRYLPKNDPALYEKAKRQAERELRLIEDRRLGGYFLIVWDLVQFCKSNGILAQGRGSAASSVVCYALEITIVDPVGQDLLFERFLSEERTVMPDIDIDTPSGMPRENAIQYFFKRYGAEGAAMTANVISFRNKSASREVGAALGFDVETAGKLAGLMSAWEWKDPSDSLENTFRAAGLDMKHTRVAPHTINVKYPAAFAADYIRPDVRLEIGPLASWVPSGSRFIHPYASESFPQAFGDSQCAVVAIDAERTFWEKATILHQEAHRTGTIPVRYSRHYYDLYKLAGSAIKESSFAKLGLLKDVVTFKERFYYSSWARYDLARPGSFRLAPSTAQIPTLTQDYRAMKEMLFREPPDFAVIQEALLALEEEINGLA